MNIHDMSDTDGRAESAKFEEIYCILIMLLVG